MNEDVYVLKLDDDPGYDSYLVPAFKFLKAGQPPRDARMFRNFRDEVFRESSLVDESNEDAYAREVEKLLYAVASANTAAMGIMVSLSSANGELLMAILKKLWMEFHEENGYDQDDECLFYKDCVYTTLDLYTLPADVGAFESNVELSIADELIGRSLEFELERNIMAYLKAKYVDMGVDLFIDKALEERHCLGVAIQLIDLVDGLEESERKRAYYGVMYEMFKRAGVLRDPDYREIVEECRRKRL